MNRIIYLQGILLSILFSLIFFFLFLPNLNQPFSLDNGDAYFGNFMIKHVVETLKSADLSQISSPPMFYGFSNSLFFSDTYIAQGVLALPLSLFISDFITVYNLLSLLTIILSFFAMFLLVFYFTKSNLASILGACVYSFNPFVMASYPNHLLFYSIQYIPLIFLFSEHLLRKRGSMSAFFLFLFLSIQLFSSLYYTVFLTIILPIYFVIRSKSEGIKIKEFFNKGFIIGLILFISLSAALGLTYQSALSKYTSPTRISVGEDYYPIWPTDWLLTGENNVIYGGLRQRAANAWPFLFQKSANYDQSLFLGVIPLILCLISFYLLKNDKIWRTFIIIAMVSFLLSFGPNLHLTEKFVIPAPYAILQVADPLLSYTRTPARFAVFVFLSLGIIAAITLVKLRSVHPMVFKVISVLIIAATMAEYWVTPPRNLIISDDTRTFYASLNRQNQIHVIADLPMGDRALDKDGKVTFINADSRYIFSATALHNKTLVNGYASFIPNEYIKRLYILESSVPIAAKIKSIRKWGADAVILHREEFFTDGEYQEWKDQILQLGIPLIASTDRLALFDLTGWF